MESGSPPVCPPPSQSPTSPPPLPPNTLQDPITSRVKLVKSIWKLFMIANLGVVAYALIMPINKKNPKVDEEKPPEEKAPQPENPLPADFDFDHYFDIVPSSSSTEPLLPKEPISDEQQKELFQWMLEEKRKIKPKDREEKKTIDKEKAVLKQFIRATPSRPI